jgi:hypothetical protein
MTLFGPGVIEEAKAKRMSAASVSRVMGATLMHDALHEIAICRVQQ